MKIAIGSDHRGIDIKSRLIEVLESWGHQTSDLGTHSSESCDYPDIAHAVAADVSGSCADRGLLICGSGIGMSIAANKTDGVRAALCHDNHSAEMSRRHNDANVLCLSADLLDDNTREFAEELIRVWMTTDFEGGRHQRRVDKIGRTKSTTKCHE